MRNLKTKISRLKSSAKRRGIPVRLMAYEYEGLLNLGCFFCGKEVLSENGYCIDRLDSKKGYTFSNVMACCKTCNMAKGSMGMVEFREWVHRVSNFLNKQEDDYKKTKEIKTGYRVQKDFLKKYKTKENDFFIGIR